MCKCCECCEEELTIEEVVADEIIDEICDMMEDDEVTPAEAYEFLKASLIEMYANGYVDAKEEVAEQILNSIGFELDLN